MYFDQYVGTAGSNIPLVIGLRNVSKLGPRKLTNLLKQSCCSGYPVIYLLNKFINNKEW